MKVREVRNHWWTFGSGGMPKCYRAVIANTVEELAEAADLFGDDSPTPVMLQTRTAVLADLARRVLALEEAAQR